MSAVVYTDYTIGTIGTARSWWRMTGRYVVRVRGTKIGRPVPKVEHVRTEWL